MIVNDFINKIYLILRLISILNNILKNKKEILFYTSFIKFLKCSRFLEISSCNVSSVYPCSLIPCSLIPCSLALANNSSSVSSYIVRFQTLSPASLQLIESVYVLNILSSYLR